MRLAAVLVGVMLTVLPTQGQNVAPNQAEVSHADANRALVQRVFQAYEQGDVATLNESFQTLAVVGSTRRAMIQGFPAVDFPDPKSICSMCAPSGSAIRGFPVSDLKSACPLCAALTDRKITIDAMVVGEDNVAVWSTWRGKYSGVLHGITVTDRDLTVVCTSFYRIANGRIDQVSSLMDSLTLAEQLGLKLVPADAGK